MEVPTSTEEKSCWFGGGSVESGHTSHVPLRDLDLICSSFDEDTEYHKFGQILILGAKKVHTDHI